MKVDQPLRGLLKKHEGVRTYPYKDTVGKLTIGVGRNLTDKGLSDDEIDMLLAHDIDDAIDDARAVCPWFDNLCDVRQRVLVDMAFNLGRTRLARFKRMLAAIAADDFDEAAREMLDSKWARQVGQRADTLAAMMRQG